MSANRPARPGIGARRPFPHRTLTERWYISECPAWSWCEWLLYCGLDPNEAYGDWWMYWRTRLARRRRSR